MRTILVIFGLWLLINVLIVVIMMPPRRPGLPPQPARPPLIQALDAIKRFLKTRRR